MTNTIICTLLSQFLHHLGVFTFLSLRHIIPRYRRIIKLCDDNSRQIIH